MTVWPHQKILQLLRIDHPVIQAPMAGVDTPELAAAVSEAGGLGSLACAMLSPDQIGEAWRATRAKTSKPVNLNFFCHQQKEKSASQQEKWKQRLLPYYTELGLDIEKIAPSVERAPFNENFCQVVEEIKPPVISFHFGLPEKSLVRRVKNTGAVILSSATTVEEAVWLEKNGCDIIIAQGAEAGGHRAMFLTSDIASQINTLDLVRKVVSAVTVPVIAAGGIADAAEIAEALAVGAAAVQLGTAYLFCPEAKVSSLYKSALETADDTALTNVFSGRPARGIINRFAKEAGLISLDAPDFPYAAELVNPLRQASEKAGSIDFMQMWSGTKRKPHRMGAGTLTKELIRHVVQLQNQTTRPTGN